MEYSEHTKSPSPARVLRADDERSRGIVPKALEAMGHGSGCRGVVQRARKSGFSLLELVIVVVIIGIIAAIAVPRLSRGTAGAADSVLQGDLAIIRTALDLYNAEHRGSYPAVATLVEQLTQYTADAGGAQATKDTTHIYGPYIREIPPLPLGAAKGNAGVAAAAGAGVGWIYDESTGTIKANCTDAEVDVSGKKYNTY